MIFTKTGQFFVVLPFSSTETWWENIAIGAEKK
jgi:hypothetical protein